MSRFPKLTETFVLYELLAVERAGARVELYPLLRERTDVMPAEARPLVARAHYLPFVSRAIVASQVWWLVHHPRRYLGTLATVVRGTLRSPNFLLGTLGIFPKVSTAARAMAEHGVDHVHCHFANHPAMAGYVIRRLVGIPYSFTAHGSDLHVDRTFLCPKVAAAAFVVAISDDNRREILETCPGPSTTERVVILHCGVDTERFAPAIRSGSPDGPLAIVSIGTLHEVKGQAVLIEACARLAQRGVRFNCRLVGEGPDRAALEARIAAAGLADRVELLGRRTREEVAGLLASADVLAAPSVPTSGGKREGIPVVLMEAMASELAVVASRLSGIPELVEDGRSGLLVPPGDADALADALAGLAADPARRRVLGAAARARVLESFDQQRNAAALLERIERSLARSAAPAGSVASTGVPAEGSR
jgi:glycosyltransferase involved in cell wall biosynthesis